MESVELTPYHEAPFGEALLSRGNLRLMLSAGSALTLAIMGRYDTPTSSLENLGLIFTAPLLMSAWLPRQFLCSVGLTNVHTVKLSVQHGSFLEVADLECLTTKTS